MLSQSKLVHVGIALLMLGLSMGCGDANKGDVAVEEIIHIQAFFQTESSAQGLVDVGRADQMVNLDMPYNEIKSYKLAVDDGFGNNVIVAQSSQKKGSETLLSHVSNASVFPVRVTETGGGQIRVEVNLSIANSGSPVSSNFVLYLIVERMIDED